jgi:proteic killer suppression protein
VGSYLKRETTITPNRETTVIETHENEHGVDLLREGASPQLRLSSEVQVRRLTEHNGERYVVPVIRSWADAETRQLYERERSRRFPPDIHAVALRKLKMLNAATRINDLLVPPSNRLEKLKGDRVGQWSIAVNMQWRICFRWEADNAHEVEIVDYH